MILCCVNYKVNFGLHKRYPLSKINLPSEEYTDLVSDKKHLKNVQEFEDRIIWAIASAQASGCGARGHTEVPVSGTCL